MKIHEDKVNYHGIHNFKEIKCRAGEQEILEYSLSLVDQSENFELYVRVKWEPVKFIKHKGRDVRLPGQMSY